ncbi:hypothetical protein DL93DRAFT_2073341 [Clavulina sp. PMI_390]|nr:hypothetical protein DL93DRAFT_2073341 [Clavulina sp. PMI_390]
MPLYELLVINSHIARFDAVRELVKATALNVMEQGGAVRSIKYWGSRNLPQRMRSHKQWYTAGDYWTMHYDASPSLKSDVESRLRQDPRVIRWTTLKLGEKLEDVVKPNWSQTIIDGAFKGKSKPLEPVAPLPAHEKLIQASQTPTSSSQ